MPPAPCVSERRLRPIGKIEMLVESEEKIKRQNLKVLRLIDAGSHSWIDLGKSLLNMWRNVWSFTLVVAIIKGSPMLRLKP
jgi:hypothetical protein